ncbi:bifunctional proline dehydrogenase/L-glutamate gamma-semialdehyde dehydrogenase [Helicobacter sp. MIT 14-3879]|uniref:bifunctional proline dehydrogenase/L-glutamate gamma-semialdehyde dehydrogenase n=1 Tax=Helicobacter sp. MIT 14-3879 TaxID=2040649 RepID=UPI000E1E82EE|nr:bifunctional proline dehydrogenase/L-glutamate gamma-semialdehyde dehydrogenase [Helicobacter sp. MIT 14-3879]RDU65546.1 1-pyrroline-5-carboxylate dehydrogenase [Helicobacter sp. MIT 14-3879]
MQELISKAICLATELQTNIQENISLEEKKFHLKMQKLLSNPKNKILLIELLDKSFRSKYNKAKFESISYILNKYGIGDFFTTFEKFLLFCFLNIGKFAPNLSVPFFINNIRKDTQSLVLNKDSTFLKNHIKNKGYITVNINFIGEEVLSEEESKARIKEYENALRSEYITYISIKITTIFSQINIIDFEYSKNEIVKRLDYLYEIATEEQSKQNREKFINLDMEEFKDLELTYVAFMESIAKFDINAGIVLQAYLPDSYHYLKKLLYFSKERVNSGKKPIKVRIVKGANMENEETISSQKDWELPTFSNKTDTDSNYKKMLLLILENDNFKYIKIGIASHNLFEIAYAKILIDSKNAQDSFSFEMLEGMSMQASKEIAKNSKLILYAPVCDISNFNNAIAYLVRRLDENTAKDNFMRHFFGLKVGDSAWERQKELFINSCKNISQLDNSTKRIQNRNMPQNKDNKIDFKNEADTDFTLSENRKWAIKIKEIYENFTIQEIFAQSKERLESSETLEIKEKINNEVIAKIHIANKNGINQALDFALHSNFSTLSLEQIHNLLIKVAEIIRNKRGDLIGIATLEVGKTFIEVDAEVSEAIDFLEFYPYSIKKLKENNPNTTFKPRGIGVVIAPWNFPIGISVGSIASALSVGNRVIYKPSSLSSLCGFKICECFWEAGIPKDALIYLPARGEDISKYLINQNEIAFAILTGGEDSAYKMLSSNPTLLLSAETGGKNATIVTKNADREQAIKNIIHSAFSNSGQKCSATSLLILEEEVYNDKNFFKNLKNATKSLNVGSPFELKNKIGALTQKPNSKLLKAINDKAKKWLIPPKFKGDNTYLMYPCIEYDVTMNDYVYKQELFAPHLSIMKAKDLNDAINIANSTGYGLTGALESLDEREWEIYKNKIEVGNAYINKPSTGAIVLRQPFGGIKKSAIGFGRKVGVYNYAIQFSRIEQEKLDSNIIDCDFSKQLESMLSIFNSKNNLTQKETKDEILCVINKAKSYAYHYKNEFSKTHQFIKVRGEDNLFLYTKIKNMLFRVSENDNLESIISVIAGAYIADIPLQISIEKNLFENYLNEGLIENLKNKMNLTIIIESIKSCIKKVGDFERIRYHKNINDELYLECAKRGKIIIRGKPLLNGRFELLYYFNEKSISISYHRYGNLGARTIDKG